MPACHLDENGLAPADCFAAADGDGRGALASEEAFYELIGLQWITPELREGGEEIDAAHRRALPQLIEQGQISGEFHGHTTWSDGKASVAEMAEAALSKGYRYWAVTDHSIGLGGNRGAWTARR